MKIFLNLLSAQTGGQITRAIELINRFENLCNNSKLIILKQNSLLKKIDSNENIIFINISLGNYQKAIKRTVFENFRLKKYLVKYNADIYISFTNTLPFLKLPIPTICCLSTLLPFSNNVLNHMSTFLKLKPLLCRASPWH